MMSKTYFIIAFKESQGILILKRKMLEKWELPKFAQSNKKPINEMVDEYIKNNFKSSHKFIGQSSIVDSYEWPKELQTITGKEGGEHRFIFVEITGKIDKEKLNKNEYDSYNLVDYDLLVEKVIFKNHKKVLKQVIEDLNKKIGLKGRASENSEK